MEEVEDWVEQEICRQLEELSLDDFEQQQRGHELGCHGDNQSGDEDAEVLCSREDSGNLEVDDISTSVFSSYLAKLDEFEHNSTTLLQEAQQVLHSLHDYHDQDRDQEENSKELEKKARHAHDSNSSTRIPTMKSGSGKEIVQAGPSRVVEKVIDLKYNSSVGTDKLSSCESGTELRRRNVLIAGHGKTTVSTDRRHSWDVTTVSRSTMLLYDPHEELFMKCLKSDKTSASDSHEDEKHNGKDRCDTTSDAESEEEMDLDEDLRLTQEMWTARVQELQTQRIKHNNILEERNLQVLTERVRATSVIQAAVRGWIVRKRLQPLIQEKIRVRRQQEERRVWIMVVLRARCRGFLFREALSKNVATLRERRRAKREAILRAVSLLQARGRGWLLRDQVKDQVHRWRELRGMEDTTSVTKLQARCRGYLLRRITTDILVDLRQTRHREAVIKKKEPKTLPTMKEQVTEITEKTKEDEGRIQGEAMRGDGRKTPKTPSKKTEKTRDGKRKKASPARDKERKPGKGIREGTVVLLQARARGLIARRNPLLKKEERTRNKILEKKITLSEESQRQLQQQQQQQQIQQECQQQQNQPQKQQQQQLEQRQKQQLQQQEHQRHQQHKQQQLKQRPEQKLQQQYQQQQYQQQQQQRQPQQPEKQLQVLQSDQQSVGYQNENAAELSRLPSKLNVEGETHSKLNILHPDLEELARTGRERSTYLAELEDASQPMSGRALLGLVHERMATWQVAQKKRRERHGKESTSVKTTAVSQHCATSQQCQSQLLENGSTPLTHPQLLHASPEGTSLHAVVQVALSGCGSPPALSSLKACPQVRSLSVTQCGLQTLSGLQACPHLCQLHVPSNEIKQAYLDPSCCGNLCFVDLSDNSLASIHGLEHCHNLLHLSLAKNRLARVSSLQHNTQITRLNLDGNLLIKCKGVEVLTELESVSMCDNHLIQVEGLENSLYLQHILLSQNNLQQVPALDSHVLLTELQLNDNNLSDISSITSAWLPRLRTLSLANNCVSRMDSLACLLLLTTLDLGYNSIYDLPVLLQSVHGCNNLKVLCMAGNPVAEEPSFKHLLHKAVPSLHQLNEYNYNTSKLRDVLVPDAIVTSLIYHTCKQQEEREQKTKEKHQNTLNALRRVGTSRDINAACAALEARSKYCHDYHSVLKHHLHELETLQPGQLGQQQSKKWQQRPSQCQVQMQQSQEAKHQLQQEQQSYHTPQQEEVKLQCNGDVSQSIDKEEEKKGLDQTGSSLLYAVTRLQAIWRGLQGRREAKRLREKKMQEVKRKAEAAIVIQAAMRGYLLRKHLHHVLEVSTDGNKYEELNEDHLLQFLDESDLEKELDEEFGPLSLDGAVGRTMDVSVTDPVKETGIHAEKRGSFFEPKSRTDQLSMITRESFSADKSGMLLPRSTSPFKHKQAPAQLSTATNSPFYLPPNSPSARHFPELAGSSEISLPVMEAWGSPHMPEEKEDKEEMTRNRNVIKLEQRRTRQEELSKEWGFSSSTTTQLMLKRAQRQKKLEQTAMKRKLMADPAARLARFRRHGPQCQIRNKDHATQKDVDIKCPSLSSSSSSVSIEQPTQVYRWVHHRDTTEHKQQSSAANPKHTHSHTQHVHNGHAHTESDGRSLPQQSVSGRVLPDMEPHVLAGYSTRLMSSESLNKLVMNEDHPSLHSGSKLRRGRLQ